MKQQLKCLLAGNDTATLQMLFRYAGKLPWLKAVCPPVSAREASHYLQEFPIDIVFYGIAPGGDENAGLLFDNCRNSLVILAGKREDASAGVQATDIFSFLTTPVSYTDFVQVTRMAWDFAGASATNDTSPAFDFVFIKSEYRFYKVRFDEILFCEGMKDYTQVYLVNKPKPIITLQNLKTLVAKLPADGFVRVHRSYVVSFRHIDSIGKGEVIIGQKHIPIGERYRNTLFAIVDQFS